jgi:hypothetical protein
VLKKKFFIGLGVLVAILVAGYINWEVYPFTTKHPNFSDVERVFNKMQFPADWQQIDESENRGTAGRTCPIEPGSACFHKSKRFKIPQNTDRQIIEGVLKQTGCPAVAFDEIRSTEKIEYTNYQCSVEGLTIDGTYYQGEKWEASFYVST